MENVYSTVADSLCVFIKFKELVKRENIRTIMGYFKGLYSHVNIFMVYATVFLY